MRREFAVARRRMVREQLQEAGVTARPVLNAMTDIPRHFFVPKLLRHRAHQPCALPIGYGQTISRPFTVGLMTSLLGLQGHEHVLEIGTGSGYQAAILSQLARSVVSVERIVPLAERASTTLESLDIDNVKVLALDGTCGLAEYAPFDAILVTACAPHLPPHLVSQLKDGGYLLIPVTKGKEQILYRYRRHGQEVEIEQSVSCRFVPLLQGVSADTETVTEESENNLEKEHPEGDQLA